MKEKEKQQGKERYLGEKGGARRGGRGGGGTASHDKEREGKWEEKRKERGGVCVCVYWSWGIACVRCVASVPGNSEGLCDLATVRAISSAAV